jgi:hypothetical protein
MTDESCQIIVSFNPTNAGSFNEEIGIISNSILSPDVVQLSGNGFIIATPVPNFSFWGLILMILLFSITAKAYHKPS